jgi:hypothetical protein
MRGLELKPYPPYPSELCTLYSAFYPPHPYLAVASTTSQAQVATTPS